MKYEYDHSAPIVPLADRRVPSRDDIVSAVTAGIMALRDYESNRMNPFTRDLSRDEIEGLVSGAAREAMSR